MTETEGNPDDVGSERIDAVGDARQRREGAHDAEDFPLGAVFRERQELAMVLFREVGSEQHECGEVELSVGWFSVSSKRGTTPTLDGTAAPERRSDAGSRTAQALCALELASTA